MRRSARVENPCYKNKITSKNEHASGQGQIIAPSCGRLGTWGSAAHTRPVHERPVLLEMALAAVDLVEIFSADGAVRSATFCGHIPLSRATCHSCPAGDALHASHADHPHWTDGHALQSQSHHV